MGYLLDTNICIYIIKKKPESVLKRLDQLPLGEIGISSLTVAELDYGARKSANPGKNLSALHQFLLAFEIFAFGYDASSEYGKIRSSLEKKGSPIGPSCNSDIAYHRHDHSRSFSKFSFRELSYL